MFPRVSIVILNWNGWKDTMECLESVYRVNYPNYDVIVVDNGSKDESIQKIKEYAEGKIKISSKFFEYNSNNKPIKVFEINEDDARQGKFNKPFYEKFDVDRRMILIKNKDNYGFAGGNNVGIKFALSILNTDYVMLLNNDTVVHPKFLNELVKAATDTLEKQKSGSIGWYAPIIFYYSDPEVIQYCGLEKFSWMIGTFYQDIPKKENRQGRVYKKLSNLITSNLFTGAAVMFPRYIPLSFGLLDENIFMGWEDNKYSFTLEKKGVKGIYVKKSKVFHKGSVKFVKKSPFRVYQGNKNKIYVIKSHANGIYRYSLVIFHLFLWMPLDIITASLNSKNNILTVGTHAMRGIIEGFKLSPCNRKRGKGVINSFSKS